MKKKKNENLNGFKSHRFEVEDLKPMKVKPTEEEAKSLSELRDATAAVKIRLADAQMRFHQHKMVVDALSSEANETVQKLQTKAVEVAKAHGINLDDPDKEQWNLDTDTMEFTRVL